MPIHIVRERGLTGQHSFECLWPRDLKATLPSQSSLLSLHCLPSSNIFPILTIHSLYKIFAVFKGFIPRTDKNEITPVHISP